MSIANLFIPNGLTLNCGYLNIENDLLVGGNEIVDGNLTVNGNEIVDGTLTVNGAITQKSYYRVDYNNSGISFASGVTGTMTFINTQASSNFTPPTGNTLYTAPVSGLYQISYTISFGSFSIGIGYINTSISTNTTLGNVACCSVPAFAASALVVGPPVSAITLLSVPYQLTGTAIIYLTPSNTFSLSIYHTLGTNLVTNTGATTFLSVNFLHS